MVRYIMRLNILVHKLFKANFMQEQEFSAIIVINEIFCLYNEVVKHLVLFNPSIKLTKLCKQKIPLQEKCLTTLLCKRKFHYNDSVELLFLHKITSE